MDHQGATTIITSIATESTRQILIERLIPERRK